MIKVKDGYAKLIGTTYLGSADRVLLSNGGDKVIGNASGNIPISNGTVNTNLNADLLDGKHDGELTAKYLKSLGRLTTASNIYGDGLLRYYQASQDMTVDKPKNDGLILHSSWENLNHGGYEAQLFLSVDSDLMQYRRASAGTWKPWNTILHSGNYSSYLGYIGTTPVQASSAAQALTGITNATMSGVTTTNTLTISNTSATGHLVFSRGSYNYILAPTGGSIAFCVNGKTAEASANSEMIISAGTIFPGITNVISLGQSYKRWSNIYSNKGNFSGKITSNVATGTSPFSISSTTLNTNLNADLLDGYHASSFEGYYAYTIDASSLNNNTWYPVTISIGNSIQTRIRVQGNTAANASWNSRSDKYMSVILDYTVNGSNWGWTGIQRVIHRFELGAGAEGTNCVAGIGQLFHSSTEYVYVRGGAKYNFYISRAITPIIRTSTYTIASESVGPTTSSPTAITQGQHSFSLYAAHFYENSDIMLKTNIKLISDSDNMPLLKEFDWKKDGTHGYGLIAQELEAMGYSELVDGEEDGSKTVNYSAALSLIVGKLQVKIKELEKEIEILKNKN